jgi:predicted cupin superfamily sugar epimerase/mannose-6-phosphate isomerase-like protein (cupin superfamily)
MITRRFTGRRRFTVLAFIMSSVCAAHAEPPTPTGTAGKLIAHYHMQRVPQEGPWFSLTYASEDQLAGAGLPARYDGRSHAAGSAIVVVETAADFSGLHRLQTDEVWHFYGGSPIDMLLLFPDGTGRKITLGPDVLGGQLPQFTVPHGVWQGSTPHDRSEGSYSFCGDQLSPAFEFADFEMGYRDALQSAYPAFAEDIARLTRADYANSPPTAAATRASAFQGADVPVVHAAPGVDLQELVGRVSTEAKTSSVSIAEFRLAPGRSSGMSFNRTSEEAFYVLSGSGTVHLPGRVLPVAQRATVYIPAGVAHSIEADVKHSLVFLAVSAPAFAPEDYVVVKP